MEPGEINSAMQTKTENGANAWATSHLADKFGFSDPKIAEMVSAFSTMWSATTMSEANVREYVNNYLKNCDRLTDPIDVTNFVALMMAYTIHKRSVRHGGGRKDESRVALLVLCEKFLGSSVVVKLLLLSYFREGYWKDAWLLLKKKDLNLQIREFVLEILVTQLSNDAVIASQLAKEKDPEKKKELIGKMSNCAKFCPQVKGDRKKKTKPDDGTKYSKLELIFVLAQRLFPNVPADTWYYKTVNGQLDKSRKIPVADNTPLFFKWRTLFEKYTYFMRPIRKEIPFVEKTMHKGEFHSVNPTMLTSQNRLRLDETLTGKLPRYLKPHARSTAAKQMTKKRLGEMRAKYGATDRLVDDDRRECAERYKKYQEELAKKQAEKKEKLEELRKKRANAKTDEEREALDKEISVVVSEKTANFSAGNPIEVLKAYENVRRVNPAFEACIQELGMGAMANLAKIPILCISDTSGSMYGGYGGVSDLPYQPIEVCVAMTAFFAMFAPEAWRNRFIQFSTEAYVQDLVKELKHEPSFFEFCEFMKSHQVNTQSTNFESVLGLLETLFRGAKKEDLPKYLIFWSDMQFNSAVQSFNRGLTAGQQLKKLFVERLGFAESDVPTIVFWNLNAYDNRPALASDEGVVMLSGFNPKMILDLDGVINSAITPEEFKKMEAELIKQEEELKKKNKEEADRMRAEIEQKRRELYELQEKERKVNTWKTLVQILSTNQATLPFLTALAETTQFKHTLLTEIEPAVEPAVEQSSGSTEPEGQLVLAGDSDGEW